MTQAETRKHTLALSFNQFPVEASVKDDSKLSKPLKPWQISVYVNLLHACIDACLSSKTMCLLLRKSPAIAETE